jgi:molybdenum cofactor guanylyltransferase
MKAFSTGVILAGGQNTRFSGKNKAFIPINGQRIIDHVYTLFKEMFEEVILVTNDPNRYVEFDCMIVTDLFQTRSSLTGLHAGLFYTSTPNAFFSACDTPFLKREVVEMILDAFDSEADVVIPETSAGLEPLCAAYSKRCLEPIAHRLVQQKLKIQGFFNKMRIKKIPEKVLRTKDPDLVSFFNINRPEDIEKAEKIEKSITAM